MTSRNNPRQRDRTSAKQQRGHRARQILADVRAAAVTIAAIAEAIRAITSAIGH